MICLKCGKKTKEDHVFCDKCLTTMEAYPVKPDVHIQLPNRSAAAAAKKAGPKRRQLTAEEQVVQLFFATRDFARDIAVEDVVKVGKELVDYFRKHHKDLLDQIKTDKKLSDELIEKLKQAIEEFKNDRAVK